MLTSDDLSGLLPALVTPLGPDSGVDAKAMARLVDRMFDAGVRGVVPLGGTGEYTALAPSERRAAVEACVAAAEGRGPVIAGVLSPGYGDAIEAGRDFKRAGANAIMLLTPFYAIGGQAGMADYIRRFRADCDLPIVLYEIPARTTVSLAPETIAALAEDGTAIGIKFSNYDVPRFHRLAQMVGPDFVLLGGEEPLVTTHISMGARGAVLATANLFPEHWVRLMALAVEGRVQEALALQAATQPLLDAVFAEANPGPLKRAMAMIGEPVGDVRLPLVAPSPETEAKLTAAIEEFAGGRRLVNA